MSRLCLSYRPGDPVVAAVLRRQPEVSILEMRALLAEPEDENLAWLDRAMAEDLTTEDLKETD